jgi:hypothetical protein
LRPFGRSGHLITLESAPPPSIRDKHFELMLKARHNFRRIRAELRAQRPLIEERGRIGRSGCALAGKRGWIGSRGHADMETEKDADSEIGRPQRA